MRDYTPELTKALGVMDELLGHIRSFDPARLSFAPAVLDEAPGSNWRGEDTQGLRKFTDSIEQHGAQLEALAASGTPTRDDPLPVVLGLATSWKSVVLSAAPVPAVRMSIKLTPDGKRVPPGQGAREAFVDVVARGGVEWIRIYSKKTSALLSEFREQDSYITDSDSEDDAPTSNGSASPRTRARSRPLQPNSLTRLVDDLLTLISTAERIPGAAAPRLTLRLTRIEEHPAGGHPDPRIPLTLAHIRARGVNLLFGDLSNIPFAALPTSLPPPRRITPSRRLNLDPTALMGLCSDLLHHPLPSSTEEARARFYRPASVMADSGHAGGGRGNWEGAGDEDAAQSQNSRELVRALMEEMTNPLVEVIQSTLAASGEEGEVELWATREAVTYLQETISSEERVGDGLEQRRMRRLTGLEEGDFWEGSRYEGKSGCLGAMKLHIFDEAEGIDAMAARVAALDLSSTPPSPNGKGKGKYKPALASGSITSVSSSPPPLAEGVTSSPFHAMEFAPRPGSELCANGMTSFHASTAAACHAFVSEYLAHLSHGPAAAPNLPSFLNPRRLPSPRVAQISTPFTVVALNSLARAAAQGMTTLSMGHVVFRELYGQPRWRVKGWTQGNYEREREAEAKDQAGDKAQGNVNGGPNGVNGANGHAPNGTNGSCKGDAELELELGRTPSAPVHAVAWILPYRSLGEAKRVKFAQGDYSFPRFVQRTGPGSKGASGSSSPAEPNPNE